MTYYGLYKITNLTNGKMYIGLHVTSNLDDGYMGSGTVLNNALKKYGIQNFRKEWLGFYEDKDELNYMERVFVDETWISRSDTYNLKVGGIGGSAKGTNKGNTVWKGRHHTEQTKKLLSESRKGIDNPFYGKHHSDEAKSKIRNAFKDKALSEEHKQKISNSNKGKIRSYDAKMKYKQIQAGRHWYNNGTVCIRARSCPEGFTSGRISRKRAS